MDAISSLVVGEEGCALNDVVEVFFNEVNSDAVFERWTDFANELGIKSLQIKVWRQDRLLNKLTLKDVLREILESWKVEKGNDAALRNLIEHLKNIKFNKIADDLKKFFSTENSLQKVGQLFKPTLPDKSNYYISRTLVTRKVIDEKVFSSTHKDVFVVHEIGRHQLSQLAKRELTDTSTGQVGKPKLSVRFILLQNFGDWALLCGKTTDPIHLLKHHEGRFHWVCTNGDISTLQTASEEKNQDELSEEEFIEQIETEHQFQPNQPICISDSPGMGKSLLLASIGRHLQQRYPQRCIAFIVISEFVVKIRELLPKSNSTMNAVLEALLQELCENTSAREQLVQKMSTPTENPCTQIELMFDGFDEVSAENFELAHECVETLKTNFNSTTRVWVTTRPQHLHELEISFSVLGYKIQAFQDKHQIDFLTSFWKSDGTKLDEGRLQRFSKTCLSTLKKKLNKRDEDIAGIPLQCMMIAEVYMQDAHRFSDSKNERFKHFAEAASVVINSIADLYQKMIEHNIEKLKTTYPLVTEDTNCIWPWLMYHALELIFPSHVHKFRNTLQIETGLKPNYFVNIGIMECSGSTTEDAARFIHRTIAEYLAARYFVTYEIVKSTADVKHSTDGLPDFLFAHMFKMVNKYSFKHSVVCYFVDTLLGSQTNTSTENSISEASTSCIKDLICACIHSNFGNLVKFLYSLKYPDSFSIKHILYSDSQIFIDATRSASSDLLMLKFLLESFEHKPLSIMKGFYPRTSLHAAVRRGSYTIFEYILKEHHFENLVKEDTYFLDLVYYTVQKTQDSDLNEIEDRVQIVTTLCDLNREMFNYCDDYNRTPLLVDRVNIKLLKTLIDCGANLLHLDIDKHTILRKATEYLSPIDYYDLLKFIPNTTLNSLLQILNEDGKSILHQIVQRGLATPDILQLILSNGFDINANDDEGLTCVFYALHIQNQDMTIPTVKLLLENGADHTRVDSDGDSILHRSAFMGRIDCLQFFLAEKNMNVNQINGEGETPIFKALHLSNSALETVQILLERGADYKMLNKHRQNVIHLSARWNQMECLQLFLTLGGLDINEVDGDGDNPLLCALHSDYLNTVEMVRLLLGKGADHTISNIWGNNVLHLVAASGNAKCFKHFDWLSSIHVNARNCDNDTPLHLVVKNIWSYFHREDDLYSFLNAIEALLSVGADVNSKNNDGKTPFHIYQEQTVKWKFEQNVLRMDLRIRRLLGGSRRGKHLDLDDEPSATSSLESLFESSDEEEDD